MSSEQPHPSAAHVVAAAAAALAVVAYPFAAEAALERWGVRAVAGAVLALGAASLVARAALDRRHLRAAVLEHGAALVLAAMAFVSGGVVWLLLFPVLVNATLCVVFVASRRADPCIVEEVARWIEPHLPDFTRGYCRALTLLWSGFFALAALGIGAVALADPAHWRTATLHVYFGTLAAVSLAEFVFRKIWFRHYTSRLVDRLFGRIFPADRTERGRRSLAYIQRMRELGLHQD
jgi:uncharacterized membrane protein